MLQELSDDGLISLHGNCLKVLNSEGLQKAGKFDPTYLHLKNRNAF